MFLEAQQEEANESSEASGICGVKHEAWRERRVKERATESGGLAGTLDECRTLVCWSLAGPLVSQIVGFRGRHKGGDADGHSQRLAARRDGRLAEERLGRERRWKI